MQIELVRRQRRYPSLTSLIDIIFLLLLFFMLSSTFNKFSELDVVGALSGGTKQGEKPDLFVRMTQDGIKINGEVVPVEQIGVAVRSSDSLQNLRAILHVGEKVTSQQLMQMVERFAKLSVKVTVIR